MPPATILAGVDKGRLVPRPQGQPIQELLEAITEAAKERGAENPDNDEAIPEIDLNLIQLFLADNFDEHSTLERIVSDAVQD
ncbi:hypothetical protein AB0H37_19010 [Actinomadura sp. NPDC023710]|uniref:hypothetical protein n=1 Tax=Actinomadura sp. NPDC023710 TaxID=3158219 RepID=UPI0033FB86D8